MYYVNENGKYLGPLEGEPKDGAILVDSPPTSDMDIWDFNRKAWRPDEKFFVDANGNYLGLFGNGARPRFEAYEVPSRPATGLDRWDFVNSVWIPWSPPYTALRQEAYKARVGSLADQIDIIQKGLQLLIPEFKKAGILSDAIVRAFEPDISAPEGTPARWLGEIIAIKEEFPKA